MKYDTASYIQEARKKHGTKYDYSLVSYSGIKNKIQIICPVHGKFSQIAEGHLRSGCFKCSGRYSDTNDFIRKSLMVHGDKYDYASSEYQKASIPVKIFCKQGNHFFWQIPKIHLKGGGCQICSGNLRLTLEEFVKRARKIHGDKYQYDLNLDLKPNQINNRLAIKIFCVKHNSYFFQSIAKHLEGHGCPLCGKGKCADSNRFTLGEFLSAAKKCHGEKYDYSLVQYRGMHEAIKVICKTHGEFLVDPASHIGGTNCASCFFSNIKQEQFIKEILKKYQIEFIEHDRKILNGKEIDFYIPSYNLGIETHGIFWHSERSLQERNAGKTYHFDKYSLAKTKGVKLIQVFESEIINKKRIVENRLKSNLNLIKRKIHGRKCEIREISTEVKNKFLNKYHLQGEDRSLIKLGLFYKNRLVSVMTFGHLRLALGNKTSNKNNNHWELIRFAGLFNFIVNGAGSKLLTYFEKKYLPEKIISYADLRWSEGNLYKRLGFELKHQSAPNYWYFTKKEYKLYHRFKFRKQELPKLLKNFDPNLSEYENMRNNHWDRIWDCGNLVFEKSYHKD